MTDRTKKQTTFTIKNNIGMNYKKVHLRNKMQYLRINEFRK